jgi:hypothetical protein
MATISVPVAASTRSRSGWSRNATTSANVYRPRLRSRSAKMNRMTAHPTVPPMANNSASTPPMNASPVRPRNVAADMKSPASASPF